MNFLSLLQQQRHPTHDSVISEDAEARALGVASIAIGLSELAAPKQVQSLLGIEDRASHRGILRVLGVREIMHGINLLAEEKPSKSMAVGVWSRVAGDVLDTALLAVAATKTKKPAKFAAVAAAVLGIGVWDTVAAKRLSEDYLS